MQDIVPIKGLFVTSYLIFGKTEIALIDGGFIGDMAKIKQVLAERGKSVADIDCILLTHGHLDHTYNIRALKKLSGAKVYGSALDIEHIKGKYPYKGSAKMCGYLEGFGRLMLGYHPFELDEYIEDEQEIFVCGGFIAIHLPGHTAGHFGFLHLSTDILFSGDLFENSTKRVGVSPYFLNSCPELLPGSLKRVIDLEPQGIFPNHCKDATPEEHLEKMTAYYHKNFASKAISSRT